MILDPQEPQEDFLNEIPHIAPPRAQSRREKSAQLRAMAFLDRRDEAPLGLQGQGGSTQEISPVSALERKRREKCNQASPRSDGPALLQCRTWSFDIQDPSLSRVSGRTAMCQARRMGIVTPTAASLRLEATATWGKQNFERLSIGNGRGRAWRRWGRRCATACSSCRTHPSARGC